MNLATRSGVRITTLLLVLGALMLPTRSHAVIISPCGGPVAGICGGECAAGTVCANLAGQCQCVNSSTFCSNQAVGTDQAPMCGGFCASQFTTCQLVQGLCLCIGDATQTPTATATLTPTGTATPTATPTASVTATATPTPTSTATPAPAGPINHFHCYEAQATSYPPFQPRTTVDLEDDPLFTGADTDVKVRRPRRICNPASKNGEDPTAVGDTTHLVSYPIRHSHKITGLPRRFQVTNQFHDPSKPLRVDFIRPEALLVPSLKSETDPVPGTPPTTIDHYQCYRVKRARFRRDPSTLPTDSIDLFDQFNSPTNPTVVTIKRPRHLCVPVIKNNETPAFIDPNTLLLCYELRLATSDKPYEAQGQIHVNNQFGDDQVFGAFRTRELCVPSQGTPAATVPCELDGNQVCGGDCPAGESCVFIPMGASPCQCMPDAQNCFAQSFQTCSQGFCPNALDDCLDDTKGGCFCN